MDTKLKSSQQNPPPLNQTFVFVVVIVVSLLFGWHEKNNIKLLFLKRIEVISPYELVHAMNIE